MKLLKPARRKDRECPQGEGPAGNLVCAKSLSSKWIVVMCNGPWSAELNHDSIELNQGSIPRSGLLSCAMTHGQQNETTIQLN